MRDSRYIQEDPHFRPMALARRWFFRAALVGALVLSFRLGRTVERRHLAQRACAAGAAGDSGNLANDAPASAANAAAGPQTPAVAGLGENAAARAHAPQGTAGAAPLAAARRLLPERIASVPQAQVPAAQGPSWTFPAEARRPPQAGELTLDVGSFRARTEARAHAQQLRRRGYPAHLYADAPGGAVAVRVGRFVDARQAALFCDRLQHADVAAHVVTVAPGWQRLAD